MLDGLLVECVLRATGEVNKLDVGASCEDNGGREVKTDEDA